ncbi:MAG: DDE-type integrase/transposase/recombinase [Cenarchaeum sp. SB0669_bin_11]|nr:DDE-type integrase/transposase/recombinase [Cenarchaeum sp. SB0675_bin_21]MYL11881.1 DDE-type integrase/transposase/recombinase [Cenarchaeum sp. SB0669_bin_11]
MTTTNAMMKTKAKGESAPMTRDLHSEYFTTSHNISTRQQRGQLIANMKNQIYRIDDTHYKVNSQSNNKQYDIISTEYGWTCSCPDHKYRHVCCKHIHAVEISKRMRDAVQKTVIIPQIDLGSCKFCSSENIVKNGTKQLKKGGSVQLYKCKDCGKKFRHNLGFERKQATPEQITMAVDLVFSGLSTRKTAFALKGMNIKVTHQTVLNWTTEYSRLMDKFMDKIQPQVGEQWRTDELYLKIKGNRKYLFAMLDSETRFWIAKMIATHKGNDDVAPMFKQAKKVAGKVPTTLISDKAANFHHAWKKQYKTKNFLHKDTEHIHDVAFDGIHHNNQMESFNGATLRHREKVCRGLKKDDSSIISGLRIYHNFVRPHLGLPNNMTPAEAAGITIEGENKILTMIRAAARSTK